MWSSMSRGPCFGAVHVSARASLHVTGMLSHHGGVLGARGPRSSTRSGRALPFFWFQRAAGYEGSLQSVAGYTGCLAPASGVRVTSIRHQIHGSRDKKISRGRGGGGGAITYSSMVGFWVPVSLFWVTPGVSACPCALRRCIWGRVTFCLLSSAVRG